MSNGYTGSGKYEHAGIVHEGGALLPCSCGGTAWVSTSGNLFSHSEPIDLDVKHLVTPFWREEIWRYELVE